MKINRKEKVKCPWCFKVNALGLWDDFTYEQCKNREMKRLYKHLDEDIVFSERANNYYKCPVCKEWSKGCQLSIVNTTNPRLRMLGGKPIIRVVNKGEEIITDHYYVEPDDDIE